MRFSRTTCIKSFRRARQLANESTTCRKSVVSATADKTRAAHTHQLATSQQLKFGNALWTKFNPRLKITCAKTHAQHAAYSPCTYDSIAYNCYIWWCVFPLTPWHHICWKSTSRKICNTWRVWFWEWTIYLSWTLIWCQFGEVLSIWYTYYRGGCRYSDSVYRPATGGRYHAFSDHPLAQAHLPLAAVHEHYKNLLRCDTIL